MPKLSIIVPIYNVEQYIHKCVDSILNQTFADFELILVDDGSPDGCGAICDEYAQKDKRIKVIHQKNSGVSVARNSALDVASGTYVMFVDSDDYVEPDLAEKCIRKAEEKDLDIVIFEFFYKLSNGVAAKNHIDEKYHESKESLLEGILWDKMHNAVWNKLFKRALWDDVRFPVGVSFEDLYVMPEIFLKACQIGYMEEWLYHYNCSNNVSITFNLSAKNKYGMFWAWKHRNELAKEHGIEELENWSRIRALRSAVTAYGLDAKQHILDREKIENIKAYCRSEKNISGMGIKYKILLYGMFNCGAICKFYGASMFFFYKWKKY